MANVETLKEAVRVRFKDNENNTYFKKYFAKDVTVIKDVEDNDAITKDDVENEEDLKELQNLEKLDKNEKSSEDY